MRNETCRCGDPATAHLALHYRVPRHDYLPGARDPFYILGGRPIRTCGSPGCEAEAVIEARESLIAGHGCQPSELRTAVVRPDDWDDFWPEPPAEADL